MDLEWNVAPAGRELACIITTRHSGGAWAMTGVHRQSKPRRQGGVRFVERGSREELAHLAHGLSDKAAAAGIDIDGMKALIICPAGIPSSVEARAALLENHIRQAVTIDDGLVFGPDMGCPEEVLDLVADSGLLSNVTGLTRSHGGLDIDANGLTATGLFFALKFSTAGRLRDRTVSIQGFGAVGAPLPIELHQAGCKIVAVSNVTGVLYDQLGLDVPTLVTEWRRGGDQALASFTTKRGGGFSPSPDSLFSIASEIFVPAARTTVLATRAELDDLSRENPDVHSIEDFIDDTGVQIICEGANHPLSFAAEAYAKSRGVQVLPDIIVNCGGMIGCCYEHDHRAKLLESPGLYYSALSDCRRHIERSILHNLRGLQLGMSAATLRSHALDRK